MSKELMNDTLIAAELARQSGFEKTYEALTDLLETFLELERTPVSCDRASDAI